MPVTCEHCPTCWGEVKIWTNPHLRIEVTQPGQQPKEVEGWENLPSQCLKVITERKPCLAFNTLS